MTPKTLIIAAILLVASSSSARETLSPKPPILNFLYLEGNRPQEFAEKLTQKLDGVQIQYRWKALEPEKGRYNFELIEGDLRFLNSKNKALWIQLQDRFFDPADREIPAYLLNDPIYSGGLARQKDDPGEGQSGMGSGWVAKQWNPALSERYRALLARLAQQFDGRIYGINLPETSIDIDLDAESKQGFSCDAYFESTLKNALFAKSAFKSTYVVQYINAWPCEWNNDQRYMSRFFEAALHAGIGLGGPDIVPYKKSHMHNSYPFFNQHKSGLSIVAFAVQKATRTYTNPATGKKFTDEELLEFGRTFLGASVIFWQVW